jgi:hypothetical protein
MYTVITKEVDGLNIVLGIDTEKIDPIATAKRIKTYLEASNEYKAKKVRFDKIRGLSESNNSLDIQGKNIIQRACNRLSKIPNDVRESDLTAGETSSLNKYNNLKVRNNDEIKKITAEFPEVEKNLKLKKTELIKKHGIYFNLKNEYENTICDKDAKILKSKLKIISGQKKFVLIDGSIIDDLRSKTFYAKISGRWEKIEVKLLSDTVDTGIFCLMEDLTDDEKAEISVQFETDRIADLSAEDKETEKGMYLDSLINQAGAMRNKLEILSDPKALEKAKDFYNTEKVVIEEKYK